MKAAYRVLAILIAVLVVVQAAAIAYAMFGLTKWVTDGGTLDKAAVESRELTFDGVVGFMVHGMNGMMLIPLVSLLLLVVAFFAKVPGAVMWAGLILVTVVVQVLLGMFGRDIPVMGALHGVNALVLFGLAVMAAKRSKAAVGSTDHREPAHV